MVALVEEWLLCITAPFWGAGCSNYITSVVTCELSGPTPWFYTMKKLRKNLESIRVLNPGPSDY